MEAAASDTRLRIGALREGKSADMIVRTAGIGCVEHRYTSLKTDDWLLTYI